ncbi:MAG TPA: mechanosensitive ion channel protein MscS [Synechococcus sp. UBA8638]|nr:mechanosensitive ion channel protein MscS [Synechococcus sp. UBA8638]
MAKLGGGLFVVWLLGRICLPIATRIARRTATTTDDLIVKEVYRAVMPMLFMMVVVWAWEGIPYEGIGDRIVTALTGLVTAVALVQAINRILTRLLTRAFQRVARNDDTSLEILTALKPMLRALIWVLGGVIYLQSLGIPLGALWALLSAGGIGAGLALQKPVAEFFEYIYILLDKPFRSGDFLHVGNSDTWAKVEQVGIHSTRLRSVDGELVVMTNSSLASQTLSNYTVMERRRRIYRFGVTYDTPPQVLKRIPTMARQIVERVKDADFDRCHFVEFGASSLDFELCYNIPTSDYVAALDAQQQVNVALVQTFAEQGIEFAFPTRTLYLNHPDQTGEAGSTGEPGQGQ